MKSKSEMIREAFAGVDIKELNEGLKELEHDLYKKGLIDWFDSSWEHPDPAHVDAVYGDLHVKDLDDRHGYGSAFLDSCVKCVNLGCPRNATPDTGWSCNNFIRRT